MSEQTPEAIAPRADEELQAAQPPLPICVVIDTNVWVSSLLLHTPTAAALLHHIRRNSFSLGLPVVVEREVPRNITKRGQQLRDKMEAARLDLGTLTGAYPSVRFGSLDFAALAKGRIAELESLIVRIPLAMTLMLKALDRVDEKRPPNRGDKQQYKDSLIWESTLELANNHRVMLVTDDAGFYAPGKNGEIDLALARECESAGASVRIYHDIPACLEALEAESPALPLKTILNELNSALALRAYEQAEANDLVIDDLGEWEIKAFATEHPDDLAVSFTLDYSAHAADPADPDPRTLSLTGEASYSFGTSEDRVTNVNLQEVSVWSGDRQTRKGPTTHFIGGSIAFIGAPPPMPLKIRREVK